MKAAEFIQKKLLLFKRFLEFTLYTSTNFVQGGRLTESSLTFEFGNLKDMILNSFIVKLPGLRFGRMMPCSPESVSACSLFVHSFGRTRMLADDRSVGMPIYSVCLRERHTYPLKNNDVDVSAPRR